MTLPITPDKVRELKHLVIPDQVIEAVNELLLKNSQSSGNITICQNKIIAAATAKFQNDQQQVCRADFFLNGWLEFEEVYRAAGWDVSYDKPGYCESYTPRFHFTLASPSGSQGASYGAGSNRPTEAFNYLNRTVEENLTSREK